MSQATPPAGVQGRHLAELDQGRFLIQRCQDCGQHIYYPREICPHCGSKAVEFVAPSGRGTVYSTTVVRRKPAEGGDYNVALVDLDEGVRLMSRVENLAPDAVQIGQRVKTRVLLKDGKGLVVCDAETGEEE
ncbi:MAG: Zn-ribbon domain-containing OB-fold protein [Burkholderiaceae bacterium]|nr:Zn-ribbon domain-containing OB-fold protein [Burkholderiaceae bacterium]